MDGSDHGRSTGIVNEIICLKLSIQSLYSDFLMI